jgi:hypothetical protein
MKYEVMAMGRIFLPLYGALMITSLMNMVLGFVGLNVPARISVVVSVLLMIGISVITFILIIQRFWSNLLSSEGYLMMTLPVCTDRLILSKLFVATFWEVASTLIMTLSILIMLAPLGLYVDAAQWFAEAFRSIPFSILETSSIVVQSLVLLALLAFAQILMLYSCMALSMISNKYRWLIAIAAYIAITTAMQIVTSIVAAVGIFAGIFESLMEIVRSFSLFGQIQVTLLAFSALSLALCAAFYFITRYMLGRRLNLL